MTPFSWKIRILFVDTDASGRIHYSSLFRHVEAAEMEFFRILNRPFSQIPHHDLKFPRVHVEADYKAALVCDDELDVQVFVERIGRTSYTLATEFYKEGKLAASSRIVIVCMSYSTQSAHPLPQDLVDALLPYVK